jgi:aspartyl-tRNA(Asn)/glutamyl-tRNA(Gln) amidotransferase subunit C
MISRADVEHVARLARLQLGEAELERMREQLSGILGYDDKLGALDTASVEPTARGPLVNVMRDDEVEPCFRGRRLLANALTRGEFFRVPRIIED